MAVIGPAYPLVKLLIANIADIISNELAANNTQKFLIEYEIGVSAK